MDFYESLLEGARKQDQPYGEDIKGCIDRTTTKILDIQTSGDRPGMLLGMIQSGKTKTFLGVLALGLDRDFDCAVVLTKGTWALAKQTFERLKQAFDDPIEDDELRVFDIMSLPKLTRHEQKLPMIIVVKKEVRNIERLNAALFQDYPAMGERRVLIIDDEADFASIGFRVRKQEGIEMQRVMSMISDLRDRIGQSSFLQVTATPYSLYLQPSDPSDADPDVVFKPVRPAFTELVPVHPNYIGGKFYFEDSQIDGSVASYLYKEVPSEELNVLHHKDERRFKPTQALTSNGVMVLRQAIVTFLVGAVIRRLQAKKDGQRPKKYSFIIHTESARKAHAWQETVIESLVDSFIEACSDHDPVFDELVSEAYADLSRSVEANNEWMPTIEAVGEALEDHLPAIQIEKVNSEKQIMDLLDKSGQLELRNRLNIFIGGQILDRGLTIGNLIGFYYGRRGRRYQQDTVLQHSRMYGARPMSDLAVTRFYTSAEIYDTLKTIHEFDAGLREAFEKGGHDQGVVFIRKEGTRIIPCSPNKVLVPTLTTLKAGKRLLPVGFQTGYKTRIGKSIEKIDRRIAALVPTVGEETPFLINVDEACSIVDLIQETLEFGDDTGYDWNVPAFKASLEYVSKTSKDKQNRGKVLLMVRRNRSAERIRPETRRFADVPESGTDNQLAKATATDLPLLMLIRQEGLKEKGWRDCPFWWPVAYMPANLGTVVFASDVNDYDEDDPDLVED